MVSLNLYLSERQRSTGLPLRILVIQFSWMYGGFVFIESQQLITLKKPFTELGQHFTLSRFFFPSHAIIQLLLTVT